MSTQHNNGRKGHLNALYNDPNDFPANRLIYAICRRASLDLRSRNARLRADAWKFYESQGINPQDIIAGRVDRRCLAR